MYSSIVIAPPALPVYVQPAIPASGYIWTPGYWAYGDAGYFWVPGTWVLPPSAGLLWTPGYWGWRTEGYYWVPGVWVAPPRVGVFWTPGYWGFAGGLYGWHAGYWGPHVGFYGGINYGFGYGGVGFWGGRWVGGGFAYNTAVVNVGGGFHNTYVDRTVINKTTINNNHYSFNGQGGVNARPTSTEYCGRATTSIVNRI